MKLHELGEFGLIRRIIAPRFTALQDRALGIGDDCAILPGDGAEDWLVTTDLLVEDVHFLRARIPPRQLGRKSLAVNLSDIAAMGGTPAACFLSISLPGDLDVEWLDAFFEGIREMADMSRCPLMGGDTTGSLRSIVINFAVVGRVARGRAKLRSGARAGDVLAVTGWLGDSGAGLQLLLEGKPIDCEDAERLVTAHHDPRPHLEEGRWLGARPEVTAMMDISDGVDSDVRRILEQSGLGGAVIDLDALPKSEFMRRICARYGWDSAELAASAGEDYCLLVAVDPSGYEGLSRDFLARFGRPLAQIGVLSASGGVLYRKGGAPAALRRSGFDHFRSPP
ncbi:MAG: thiamine-phosphate kinase [Kiritimatiellae bacterium]|nr:thiamine-phosphate kinase [Kiritimatiellia bacterium]MDW8458883.1 thiamine-phosphate kinase [Verrucomicrobiota bacterium]